MPTILKIARRELRRMASKPIYWFCMIAAPLFCFVFFTSLMAEGLPTDMPLGLVDNDNTTTSRSLARNLDAFEMTSIKEQYANVTEAREAVQRGDIYGFYYIPKGTTRKAQRQELPVVSFYTNYSYLVAGSLLYRDMRTMSELASGAASRTVLYAKGATERQAMAFLQPIVIDSHAINNPWLNYNVYLSNVILPGLLMLFIFMVTVFSIGTEVKYNTVHDWLIMARGSMFHALAGKLLPQTLIFFLIGIAFAIGLYGVLHFPTLRLSLSFASLWGVISFSICGMSYPVMAMHPTLQGLSLLFPLRHYFLLYVNCALDGYPLMNAAPYVVGLLLFAMLPLLLLRRLKKMLLVVPYIP